MLTVTEIREGNPTPLSLELLALARALADGASGQQATVSTIAFGPRATQLAAGLIARGADRVLTIDAPDREGFDSELWCATIAASVRQLQTGLVLLGHTASGGDVAPRLAFRLGGAVATGCTAITRDRGGLLFTRSCYGGNAREQLRLTAAPAVATVRKAAMGALPFDATRRGTVQTRPAAGQRRTCLLARQRDTGDAARLEDARVIVAGGRGVGGAEGFTALRALAATLGGVVGATRVACDLDWCQRSWQIGLTGKTVSPELYIAVGISGASHHMAGCAAASTMVAINRDPQAPIFQYARFGITHDGLEIVAELDQTTKRNS